MTELEVRRDYLPDTPLVAWAQEADAAYRIAQRLVRTPFCPQSLQDPAAAAAAILAGQEVHLAPMAALRSIDIIQGTPAMRAIAQRALVQGAGHDVWVEESTDSKAVVCGQRAGSERVQKSTWTMDRASKLGLTSKANWKNQPGAMLVARATSEVCRLVASDVLLGLAYSAEELENGDGEDVPSEAPKRARRKPSAPAVETPEPEMDSEPSPPTEDEKKDWPPVEDMVEPELEP